MSEATSPASSRRSRRGRLLIVGEIAGLDRALAQQHPVPPTIRVQNVFEAMGEILSAPAAAPIATIALPDHAVPSSAPGTIDAIRKLDPSCRIVVITHRDSIERSESVNWQTLADECMQAPISVNDLHVLFNDDAFADARDFEAPTPVVPMAPPQSEPSATPARIDDHVPAMPSTPLPISKASPPAIAPQNPADLLSHDSSAETLGDTDLVEAILLGSGAMESIALQMIAQQTGWTDLERTDQPPSADRDGCAVSYLDQSFGYISSAMASAAELQPWTDWLARWMALDRTHQRQRQQCMEDDLTGAGNRRCFDLFLQQAINRANKERRPVTLMVFDIDNFKLYNDQFGHDAGDDILRESVKLMQSVIRKGDRVCRIGGDEFAVVFADDEAPREAGSKHPDSVETIAKRFQDQICKMKFPKLGPDAPGTLTISAGLATYPWDGGDPVSLLRRADHLALESKRRGKNIITFGKGAMRVCGTQG